MNRLIWAFTVCIQHVPFTCTAYQVVNMDHYDQAILTLVMLNPDIHCLSLSIQIYVNNLNQVILLSENSKWTWYLNLFSRTWVNRQVKTSAIHTRKISHLPMPDKSSVLNQFEPHHQKTYLWTCVSSKVSDQPTHFGCFISIFPEQILYSQGCKVSLCGQGRLTRLRGCSG